MSTLKSRYTKYQHAVVVVLHRSLKNELNVSKCIIPQFQLWRQYWNITNATNIKHLFMLVCSFCCFLSCQTVVPTNANQSTRIGCQFLQIVAKANVKPLYVGHVNWWCRDLRIILTNSKSLSVQRTDIFYHDVRPQTFREVTLKVLPDRRCFLYLFISTTPSANKNDKW